MNADARATACATVVKWSSEKFHYGGTLGNKGTGIKNVGC